MHPDHNSTSIQTRLAPDSDQTDDCTYTNAEINTIKEVSLIISIFEMPVNGHFVMFVSYSLQLFVLRQKTDISCPVSFKSRLSQRDLARTLCVYIDINVMSEPIESIFAKFDL